MSNHTDKKKPEEYSDFLRIEENTIDPITGMTKRQFVLRNAQSRIKTLQKLTPRDGHKNPYNDEVQTGSPKFAIQTDMQ